MSKVIISSLFLLSILFSPLFLQAFQVEGIYPISKMDGEYHGEGVEWILDHHNTTQFILFGEQHGVKGIAEFVEFIYTSLNDSGFYHLALEADRWTLGRMGKKGVESFIREYPHSIAFDSNGDLDLMESAISRYGGNSASILWGMDQMITAIHPFQRLAELAPNIHAERLARGASLKATLKMGEYLREEHFSDLAAIEKAFGQDISDEASLIINDLRTSMDIYTKWRAGARGEISRKISPEIRENMMKKRLDAYLSQSNQTGRAVFKMGGAHTMYGIGPNGVETLGEHAQKIAEDNDMQSLSIGIRSFNAETGFPTDEFFNESNMILIDVEQYLQDQKTDTSLPKLSKYDDQFDALVYLKNTQRAPKSRIYKAEQDFQQSFITRMSLGVVLALILLSTLFPLARLFYLKKQGREEHPIYPMVGASIIALVFVAIFGFQIFVFLNYPAFTASLVNPSISIWVFISGFLLSGYLIYLQFLCWQKKWWSRYMRIYFSVFSISFAAFSYFLYYWNIGGMFGNVI